MISKIAIAATGLAMLALAGTAFASADKVLLCHATESDSNPFTLINVSANSVAAHVASGDFVAPGTTTGSCVQGPGGGPGPNLQ